MPGVYTVLAYTTVKGVATPPAICTVTVGVPVPPVPPGPVPPGPVPVPAPLRVLILYETKDTLTAEQQATLFGADVRAYLDAHCLKDGKQPAWRVWDKDVDAKNDAPEFQAALSKPHPSLPWIVIGNGTAGFEGPLPATKAEVLTLLKKWGGA